MSRNRPVPAVPNAAFALIEYYRRRSTARSLISVVFSRRRALNV
ncbi:MAG TPA: hypothetical protein VEZ40_01245 [Pyrinomonadaceae bacterium]|nr:hypothetical protein [Pyrinomonadaceae bacterium]